MIEGPELEMDFPLATAGDIAVNNLQSARQQSWSRFWQEPRRSGIAEYIVEQEQLAAQFLGDLGALDRLGTLVNQLARVDPESMRTALITAQVASMTHRFAEARSYLAQAEARGAPPSTVHRLSLSVDQACGTNLDAVLAARSRMAAELGRLENLVPLGALLADLREFHEADCIYHRALGEYQDVSPFAVAWVCFQLGVLWGELVPKTRSSRAARWYQKAIEYLPSYVKARVHLAEIYSRYGRRVDAEALLIGAAASGDPEVCWRLADVMYARGRFADAEAQMQAARSGFGVLLEKHLLAFADHGVEFYSGSGNDAARALELAMVNVANRPTLRAFEQAYATAVDAGEPYVASEFGAAARKRWGGTAAFQLSPLAACRLKSVKNDPGSFENGAATEVEHFDNPGVLTLFYDPRC
jgi:tetratricopeptide (TPR) repeat protein